MLSKLSKSKSWGYSSRDQKYHRVPTVWFALRYVKAMYAAHLRYFVLIYIALGTNIFK